MRLFTPTLVFSAILVLTGCTAVPAPTDPLAADPAPSTSSDTAHGNISKGLGDSGAIFFPNTEDDAITFTVTGVERNPSCTNDESWLIPSENGQYIALSVEIITSPDYLSIMPADSYLRWFWHDWHGYLADGTLVENSPAGLTCFPEDESVPLDIPAGETITAKYVLDMAPEVASVAWIPSTYVGGTPDGTGWEWTLP